VRSSLFRRVAVGTFAAAAAIGLSTLFAAPANAHTAGVSGKAVCVKATGTWTITWTLTNDHFATVTLSNVVLTPADADAKIPTTIAGKGGKPKTAVTFTSTAMGSAQSASLSFDAHWADDWPKGGVLPVPGATVALEGPCVAPTPSSPPPPPTEAVPSPSASPSASRSVAPPAPTPSATPGLPVTGSSTTLPMVGTGTALVAGGAVLVVALRRRRRVTVTAE